MIISLTDNLSGYTICILVSNMLFTVDFAGIPYITDCVMGELEKLGAKYKIALK